MALGESFILIQVTSADNITVIKFISHEPAVFRGGVCWSHFLNILVNWELLQIAFVLCSELEATRCPSQQRFC